MTCLSDPQLVSEVALPPGGFKQFNSILHSNDLTLDQGYAKIERISGEAPYYAYAVINDQVNSDGSFVAPVREDWMAGRSGLTLPVVVETGESHSEVIVSNWSSDDKTLTFDFVDSDIDGGKSLLLDGHRGGLAADPGRFHRSGPAVRL